MAHTILLIMCVVLSAAATCSALYKSLDDKSTMYWASESRLEGEPIHSYSSSRLFCQSLGGDLPTGSDTSFLTSFLPMDTYHYWLAQGDSPYTWADGTSVTTEYDAVDGHCTLNCGIHFIGGRLVLISMDEEIRGNIVCKIVIGPTFFFQIMTTEKVLLSSDQHEVVLAAEFVRTFLNAGFAIGIIFAAVVAIVFYVTMEVMRAFTRCLMSPRKIKRAAQEKAYHKEERVPLEA